MHNLRWEQIQGLFHQAADLSEVERRTFLENECSNDEELKSEVLVLLEEDARSDGVLDRGVAHTAQEILSNPAFSFTARDFGPYRIVRVLGEGGMGVVYLAERADLGNPVAIKILRDAYLSPARRERFASEQRMLAQLNHPAIARLYDADTLADGTPYFVMEYVEGLPLTEYCRRNKSSITARLALFRSVCEAVQYAHAHTTIHRDLKPSNILVKEDGAVKLLDFGIAKQLAAPEMIVDQTRTGLRLMTPAYAAPEQLSGDGIGIRTDVYSLGVVLYELLVGRLPFDFSTRTPGKAELIILQQEPERPSVGASKSAPAAMATKSSWADLDVLCLVAMRKDPERRYRSVEALIRDVDHYLSGEPLEARPDSLPYKVGKFVKRNRRALALVAAVIAIVIGLVVFFTIRVARARDAALAQAARAQRIQQFMLNLFTGGDQETGPSPKTKVATLLDRGMEEAKSLNAEPEVQASLYDTLGTIYQQFDQREKADSLLQLALKQRKARLGPDHPEVADTLLEIGNLRVDQGRFAEAKSLLDEGLAKRHFSPDDPRQSKYLTALGRVLVARGDYAQAISKLDQAMLLQSRNKQSEADLMTSVNLLANTHFYLGDYAASDALNRKSLALDLEWHGERHPDTADDLINLGSIQQELEHYAQAEQYLRRALAIEQSWYGKDHSETARAMAALTRTLVSEGKYEEAASLIEPALATLERVHGKVHTTVATALASRGRLELSRGNLDGAEADYSRTRAIYRSLYADKHYYVAVALSGLAEICLARKQYDRAEQLFREAVKRYKASLPPNHPRTGAAEINLGRTLVYEKRYAEAEQYLLSGYRILTKLGNPRMHAVQEARQNLVTVYGALHQPSKAKEYLARS